MGRDFSPLTSLVYFIPQPDLNPRISLFIVCFRRYPHLFLAKAIHWHSFVGIGRQVADAPVWLAALYFGMQFAIYLASIGRASYLPFRKWIELVFLFIPEEVRFTSIFQYENVMWETVCIRFRLPDYDFL